jgi:hypothetical protein
MSLAKLRVSSEVAAQAGRRSPVENAKVEEVRRILGETIRLAESC